ncbi:MAG: hypothetical protein SVR08_16655 [Spirochaetota bacterium]|nr:hypothetical protein [Spirochaetota bacterium]
MKTIRMNYKLILILTLLFLVFFPNLLFTDPGFNVWEISKDRIIRQYFQKGKKYIEFSPDARPKYKNKIMNYIIAIDGTLKKKIKIIRKKADHETDFLFVNNKLYSVRESYFSIKQSRLNTIIKDISSEYSKSSVQKDNQLSIYSFSNDKTKVILIHNHNSEIMDCKIYFYASKLFRMLISES